MNEFNRYQMAIDEHGFLESCDFCNRLIHNWGWMGWSWVMFDNQIACNECRGELLKEKVAKSV